MKREIEFRAWDVENNIMVYDNENDTYGYWDGCQDSDLGMINHLLNRKEYIFMQYTGLKDKNGKKIFEGDILDNGAEYQYIVKWNKHRMGFSLYSFEENPLYDEMPINVENIIPFEVIGNIYESKGE